MWINQKLASLRMWVKSKESIHPGKEIDALELMEDFLKESS